MEQIAQYLSTLGRKEPFIGGRVGVGILLDNSNIHFMFAPFMLENKVHLPIVLISPPLPWKSGIMLTRGVCVAMCLIQALSAQRLIADEAQF